MSGAGATGAFGSGMSVIAHSVVKSVHATEAAFFNAEQVCKNWNFKVGTTIQNAVSLKDAKEASKKAEAEAKAKAEAEAKAKAEAEEQAKKAEKALKIYAEDDQAPVLDKKKEKVLNTT